MSADLAATPGDDRPSPRRRTTDAVACLACGCLCDDLVVTVEGRAVVEARNACAAGREWFRLAGDTPPTPEATIDGQGVATPTAIDRAAEILSRARAPVVFGLTWAVTETVRAALELAEVLGARVVLGRSGADLGHVAAFQNLGRVSATLGEVKNRADVVVF
jgi:formylmethanofuran dehydrogenase subunit B